MGLSLVWLSTVLVRGGKPQILKCTVSIWSKWIGIFVRIAKLSFFLTRWWKMLSLVLMQCHVWPQNPLLTQLSLLQLLQTKLDRTLSCLFSLFSCGFFLFFLFSLHLIHIIEGNEHSKITVCVHYMAVLN